MKVRWLLVASMFMAMVAVASVSSVSAAPSVTTEMKAGLLSDGEYPFAHGVADYKVRAGGGSSLAVSVQGAQAVRFQTLYVYTLDYNTDQYYPVCTLHIGINGNGSCIVDTRTGAIVPTIVSGTFIEAVTTPDAPYGTEVVYGYF